MPGRVTSIEVAPPNRMGEARNHRTENALDRLALVEIGIPFLLVRQRRLLAESGKRDLTVAILDQVAPMLLGPEACLIDRLIERADGGDEILRRLLQYYSKRIIRGGKYITL